VSPTSELSDLRLAFQPLRLLYGSTYAEDFGTRALRVLQQEMIELEWCRTNINTQINKIRRLFKWAVAQEMVASSVYQALQTVEPLKKGRSEARESEPVRPVPEELIEGVWPHVSRQVWALIRLQLLTGARAGELVELRPVDLDMQGKVWLYRPDNQ